MKKTTKSAHTILKILVQAHKFNLSQKSEEKALTLISLPATESSAEDTEREVMEGEGNDELAERRRKRMAEGESLRVGKVFESGRSGASEPLGAAAISVQLLIFLVLASL